MFIIVGSVILFHWFYMWHCLDCLQCVVFNCSDGLDYIALGKFFKGLASCGAWSCFDEFNRLEEAVLSAVSMQIQTIQAAIRGKAASCELLEREVNIDPNSGIFITMNPAGKGYGGRQKLPDNLKQLFRPVAMSRPDNEQIAEVILFSEGFKEAKEIGRKLVAVFNLSKWDAVDISPIITGVSLW